MSFATELCVDSLDSVILAHKSFLQSGAIVSPATITTTLRFELCSSLYQGGLTPSCGFVQSVIDYLNDNNNNNNNNAIELYLMIRCRPGLDFVYSQNEITVMSKDVETFAKLFGGENSLVKGIVFGALKRPGMGEQQQESTTKITKASGIDLDATFKICLAIQTHQPKWTMTFHRAIDYLGEDAKPFNLENNQFYYFAKVLQELSQFPQIRFVLTSGGITQNASEKNGDVAVDFISNRVLSALVRQKEENNNTNNNAKMHQQKRIGILLGGGVNKAVLEKVYAAKMRTANPAKHLFELIGVHFSGKNVVKQDAVPESETFWSLNQDVVNEMFETVAKLQNGKTVAI